MRFSSTEVMQEYPKPLNSSNNIFLEARVKIKIIPLQIHNVSLSDILLCFFVMSLHKHSISLKMLLSIHYELRQALKPVGFH